MRFKRIKSMLLAAAMAATGLVTAMPVMAADGDYTTATLQITGIKQESWEKKTGEDGYAAGSTEVYAYPVVQDSIDANGNHYWQYGSDASNVVKDYVKTASETGKFTNGQAFGYLYTNLNKGEGAMAHDGNGLAVVGGGKASAEPVNQNVLGLTYDESTETWSASGVKAGLYLIAANNQESSVSYSPTIVPVNFTFDASGEATLGNVVYDENGNPSSTNATQGVVKAAVKKADEPTLDKTVQDKGSSYKYSDANIGDTVSFQIKVHIPGYGDAWNTGNLRYVINDSLSAGLTLNTNSIRINGKAVSVNQNGKGTCTEVTDSASSITVNGAAGTMAFDLRHGDVFDHKGTDYVITYSATVNDKAGVNFDEETNTASLQYSTTSNGTDLSTPKNDRTHHYTFGFDANLNGAGTEKTSEITKYGVKTTTETNNKVPLQDAQFQLFKSGNTTPLKFTVAGQLSQAGNARNYITTDKDGALTVTGLEAGTYTLKESKAPNGYSLDKTAYTVIITPTYNEDGTLRNYTVQVNGETGDGITFTHQKLDNGGLKTTDNSTDADTFAINNTPLSNLPSTGARGIIALSVAAIAMMAAFGFGFVMLKKNGKKKV